MSSLYTDESPAWKLYTEKALETGSKQPSLINDVFRFHSQLVLLFIPFHSDTKIVTTKNNMEVLQNSAVIGTVEGIRYQYMVYNVVNME